MDNKQSAAITAGTIVYHKKYGFGIVLKYDESDSKPLISFWDDGDIFTKKDVALSELCKVSTALIEDAKAGIFWRTAPDQAFKSGTNYFRSGKLWEFAYKPESKEATAYIKGSYGLIYHPSIGSEQGGEKYVPRAYFRCSCGKNKACSHVVAVSRMLKAVTDDLESHFSSYDFDKLIDIPKDLQNEISSISAMHSVNCADAKKLFRLVHEHSKCFDIKALAAAVINSVYENLKYNGNTGILDKIVFYLLAEPDIYNYFPDICESLQPGAYRVASSLYGNLDIIQDKIKGFEACSDLVQLRMYFNEQYEDCIKAFIQINRGIPGYSKDYCYDKHPVINYIPESFAASKELQDEMAEFIRAGYEGKSAEAVMRLLDDEHMKSIYLSPEYKGTIPDEIFIRMSPADFLQTAVSRNLSNEILIYMLENIDGYIEADAKAVALIFDNECDRYIHNNIRSDIIKKSSLLPDSEYFVSYLKNSAYDYYYYDNKAFDSSAVPLESVDENKLLTYFTPAWHLDYYSDDEPGYTLDYMLMSPSGTEAVLCTGDERGKLSKKSNYIDLSRRSPVFKFLTAYIDSHFKDAIQTEMAKHDAVLNEINNRKMYDLFESDADFLSGIKNRQVFGKSNKCSLELYIDTCSEKDYLLSLKLGDTKKYVISDLPDFFGRFEDSSSYTYGKSFVLTHDLSNFEARSAEILDLLLSVCGFAFYFKKKNMVLTHRLCRTILLLCKGLQINIDGHMLYVSEDEMPIDVCIDDKHRLKLTSESGIVISSVLDLGDRLLAISEENAAAYFVPADVDKNDIIKLASRYNGIDVTPVMDVVKSRIIPYFRDNINIANEIENEFPLSDIKIKAYFDYNDKELSLETKIFSNDQQIKCDMLSGADLIHYERYRDIIDELGFVDGLISNDAMVLNFFRTDFTSLKKYCDVMLSQTIAAKRLCNFGNQTVKIRHESNITKAFFVQSEFTQEELELLYRAIKRKKSYVLLSDERIVAIDNESAAEFKKTVDDLQLDPKHFYEEKKLSLVQSLKALSHKLSCQPDEYLSKMIGDINGFKDYSMQLPAINGSLRQYQIEGIKWLRVLSDYGVGGILADDMGLGKTIEVIGLIVSDRKNKPSLILCPKSMIFNWRNEFAKFAPDEKVVEIYGPASERQRIISDIDRNEKIIYISSYDSLRNDMACYDGVEFNYIIADEAQNIKNTDTQKSKNTKQLKAVHKFALTGTPIENSVADLWSIFDFIMPGYFTDLNSFMSEYSDNDAAAERLSKQIAPFLLRRTKENVLKDLPDKFEHVVTAEMSQPQRKLYDAFINKARTALEDGSKAFDMLPYITRLRQICVDPGMFVEDYDGASGKLTLLSQMLDEYIAAGHKILIFSQFVKALESIAAMLDQKGLAYFMLTGDTAADKRISYAESFNSGSTERVFLISLKAGGTGLNLTGADTVIHIDPWWNIAAENQASDRAHRIGQIRNVEVIKLICENSIEQRVVELQNIKKNTIDKLIAKDDTSVTSASLEDIAFILE